MAEKPKSKYVNGYGMFIQELALDTNLPISERGKVCGEEWRKLTPAERDKYNKKYQEYKAQYEKKLEEYYAANPDQQKQDKEEKKNHLVQMKVNKLPKGFQLFALVHTIQCRGREYSKIKLQKLLLDSYKALDQDTKDQFRKRQSGLKSADKATMKADFITMFMDGE